MAVNNRSPRSLPAKVLIVDDHPLVREGLTWRISSRSDMVVCGEASGVDEALQQLRATQPDVMIVDLSLRDGHGLDLIQRVRTSGFASKILVMSAHDESLYVERAIRAGAHGYVDKQQAHGVVIDAILALLRGELYFSSEFARRVAAQPPSGERAKLGIESLTDRELQIFELLGKGHGTRAIAEQLHRSVHTVETHREKIRLKLGLRDGTELLRTAVQWVLEARV